MMVQIFESKINENAKLSDDVKQNITAVVEVFISRYIL
jgi:hypothetical protein